MPEVRAGVVQFDRRVGQADRRRHLLHVLLEVDPDALDGELGLEVLGRRFAAVGVALAGVSGPAAAEPHEPPGADLRRERGAHVLEDADRPAVLHDQLVQLGQPVVDPQLGLAQERARARRPELADRGPVVHEGERDAAVGVLAVAVAVAVLDLDRRGAGRLLLRVLIGQVCADLVGEPEPVPRPLVVAVDGADGERRSGVLGIGEDRELVAAPELEIDGPVGVVRALDLHGADVVERGLGLGVLHDAVDVVWSHRPVARANRPARRRRRYVAGRGCRYARRAGRRPAGRTPTGGAGGRRNRTPSPPRGAAGSGRTQIVERLVLDRAGQPRPVVAQARLDFLDDPALVVTGTGEADIRSRREQTWVGVSHQCSF